VGTAVLVAAVVPAARAQDDPGADPPPAAEPGDGVAVDPAVPAGPRGLAVISRVLPVGRPHHDVVYPVFDGKRLSTVVRAEVMSRRDDLHLDFGPTRIELFGDGGRREYEVDLKSAVYYLESEQLSSDEESVVTAESFTLRGDAVVFDVLGRIAEFRGNVHMVIHDPSVLAPPEPPSGSSGGAVGAGSGGSDPPGASTPTPPATDPPNPTRSP
jgi:hypothetical protein